MENPSGNTETLCRGRRPQVPEAMPPRKASKEVARARTKTDTGRRVENTKAIEITLVKELGNIVR